MYDKNLITKFINKYYLNKLVPTAQLEATSDGNLFTSFRNNVGNLRGEITLSDIQLPEGLVGVYETEKLLAMMAILEDSVVIDYKGENSDKSIVSLEMSDNKGRRIKFNASPLSLIDYDGKKLLIKSYQASIDLNNETVNDFLKCLAAIPTTTVNFVQKNDKLMAIFGDTGTETDQVEIELEGTADSDFDSMAFPAKELREIFSVNNKAFDTAEFNISSKGILRILFEDSRIKSEYWLRENN